MEQTRILPLIDKDGQDVTPSLAEFLEKGSRRQPKPTNTEEKTRAMEQYGIISSRILTAKEMMTYKRNHWVVENGLHYVLDETFGEDKCTIRAGKFSMATLRKCAYNIVRLIQRETPKKDTYVPDIIDDIRDNIAAGAKRIFEVSA